MGHIVYIYDLSFYIHFTVPWSRANPSADWDSSPCEVSQTCIHEGYKSSIVLLLLGYDVSYLVQHES